jgi:hypothetical protein
MPFGFVTKAQLEAHAADLRREIEASRADQDRVAKRIALEWEEWWEKFSRLYARLSKRVKDAEVTEGGKGGDGPGPHEDARAPSPASIDPNKLAAWRARRGF